jgi:hypothetical protein
LWIFFGFPSGTEDEVGKQNHHALTAKKFLGVFCSHIVFWTRVTGNRDQDFLLNYELLGIGGLSRMSGNHHQTSDDLQMSVVESNNQKREDDKKSGVVFCCWVPDLSSIAGVFSQFQWEL